MDPHELWRQVAERLRALAQDAVDGLVRTLPELADEPSVAGTVLAGRLLSVHDRLPAGNSLVELVREVAGDLGPGSPVRLHGWRRAPGAPVGVALVVAGPGGGCAVLGLTPAAPRDPVFDVVVTPDAVLTVPPLATGPWTADGTIAAGAAGWDAAFGPGTPPPPPGGTATIRLRRTGRLAAGAADGPHLGVQGVDLTVTATPGAPTAVELGLRGVDAAVLPAALARMVGLGGGRPMTGGGERPVDVVLRADRAGGLRFAGSGGLRADLPLRVTGPGISSRGAAVELTADGDGPRLGLSVSLAAQLPALPLRVALDRAGIDIPAPLSPTGRLGLDPARLRELFPEGIGTDLTLPPVSGGGLVRRLPDGSYAGLLSIDLGVLRLQAIGVFRPPTGGVPTSFLVLLAAHFPEPGVQLGLGFALDAVGGLVGVNRRVDVTELRQLVADGNADRVLFPANAVERSGEIIGALTSSFPVAPGRMLVGPMVQLSWGRRIVTLSGALVLELPAPVRAVLVGRLLVAMPDPVVPLVRLQASVFGRVDPGVPVVEMLVSLAGSWIVGLAVRGEMYLLVRGGAQPEFVLSAGGFHPRYARPPGVPALRRLQVDLAPGGGFGLRMEAYFAVTSNAVMFGGQVQLNAMIAGCGVQGWLGLDALFVFDPTFAFSVRVRAGVAVRAFGRRLAGVALDFTLEGPAPWHAFGTGSISVLFWDVELDFDVRWGAPPAVAAVPGRDPLDPLRTAVARPEAWVAERPAVERTALTFTSAARTRMLDGSLLHPDATVQMRQKVLPLGAPISRFERRPVPVQTWTVAAVTLGATRTGPELAPLTETFVPGEFFELNEEQQLSEPAFVVRASGVRARADDGVRLGAGHRVDDGYETAYEPPLDRDTLGWPGLLGWESVLAPSAAERLERWRAPSAAVRVRRATLSAAAPADLRPLVEDVSLVSATADALEAVRDQLDAPDAAFQLVESWELGIGGRP